ncbi:hypothetical protein BX616_008212 [Lobosporangium transversale]|uniref:Uncharacterized protein n=1 Tax=Lobosporangium transversale TaxID=64571 RepID=A0A1Y2H301_9FUNG|nr:hypothetical protein BCR41DRAFT_418198 [Lobosporangium transversale]KAF9918511.1 hypothetical protein BX616_008212 [Lobosporangium transversale]ORZ28083.1 hypothetical protein BCR41DRAFT_418198 [Lobosporangium transversale]|eukprot:XP_021885768.1 hypothetical protein BCR41DRAFT_418198 [Lobosporangium transversale]
MRGSGKGTAKDSEEYEDHFLHQTIGAPRIRSHTARYGHHKVMRHHHLASSSSGGGSALPTTSTADAPGAAGTTASSVSAYLEHLPSLNLNATPPPRPPRPPGGLLGISNGRGIGYGRSLGSSNYDSPLTIHGSFDGHVRSEANLYGGKNQSSGLLPVKSLSGGAGSGNHHRPSTSIFPIQKALEIAMKESRLLAAASSRGGAGSAGTGMITGTTFVRELRRARHARGAIITEHGPTPDISLDEDEDEDTTPTDADVELDFDIESRLRIHGSLPSSSSQSSQSFSTGMDTFQSRTTTSTTRFNSLKTHNTTDREYGDIRIQRPAITAFESKAGYPGIAYLPHTSSSHAGIMSLRTPGSLRNVPSTKSWGHISSSSGSALISTSASNTFAPVSISSSSSSSIPYSEKSLELFVISSTSSTSTPYQSHCSPVLPSSSSSTFASSTSSSLSSSSRSESAVHAVRELLDSYPAPSPYCVDDKKRSPLHFAAAAGDLELVEYLLERGVRPDCGRDIAGNMPLHLAIISNKIDVVAALLRAGADMTLASPMTHKTPLDLAESRLSYLLSCAQESVKQSQEQSSSPLDLHNNQIATRSTFRHPSSSSPSQSQALLRQIRDIVNLLRPYVVRQQKMQHSEQGKERQKERSWERADKYMRQHEYLNQESNSSGGSGLWRVDPHSDDNFGDMEDEDEDDDDEGDDDRMDMGERRQRSSTMNPRGGAAARKQLSTRVDVDGDVDFDDDSNDAQRSSYPGSGKMKRLNNRRLPKRMDANETEEALENLMNGLSLLEANRKQIEQQQHQQHQHHGNSAQMLVQGGVSDSTDGNLADSELDPRSEQEVDEALPDLLEQVQQVLEAIKLNENTGS